MAKQKEIPKYLLTGAVHFAGAHDSGKTTLATHFIRDPERSIFFDFDVKGKQVKQVIPGLRYVNGNQMRQGKQDIKFLLEFLELLRSLEPGSIDWMLFDTWPIVAKAFHTQVVLDPTAFRHKESWAPLGSIKGPQMWQEAGFVESQWIDWMVADPENGGLGAKVVFLVTHMKGHYIEVAGGSKVATGKEAPDASRAVIRSTQSRFWLYQRQGHAVPGAIVLKRPQQMTWNAERSRVESVQWLPPKITPLPGDRSLVDQMERYYVNPYQNRSEHLDSEQLTQADLDMISLKFTKDEFELLKAQLSVDPKLAAVAEANEVESKIVEMITNGASNSDIRAATSATLPTIIKIRQNLGE